MDDSCSVWVPVSFFHGAREIPVHWWTFARLDRSEAWNAILRVFHDYVPGVNRTADIAWLRRHHGFRLVKARIVLEPLTAPSPLPPAP